MTCNAMHACKHRECARVSLFVFQGSLHLPVSLWLPATYLTRGIICRAMQASRKARPANQNTMHRPVPYRRYQHACLPACRNLNYLLYEPSRQGKVFQANKTPHTMYTPPTNQLTSTNINVLAPTLKTPQGAQGQANEQQQQPPEKNVDRRKASKQASKQVGIYK